MGRILIADTPAGFANLERILGTDHHLVAAHSMSEAIATLERRRFDLVIVGVHFDESRSFDLMDWIKSAPRGASKPFILFCSRDTRVTRLLHDSLEVASRALGAWMYLDQHRYNMTQEPDAELRHVIERCLAGEARKRTSFERMDLQAQRDQIQRMRSDLLAEDWSPDLEEKLRGLRDRLAELLLELSRAHVASEAQQEEVAASREREDRVSAQVASSENGLAHGERDQGAAETEQSEDERSMNDQEEEKERKGRRGHHGE